MLNFEEISAEDDYDNDIKQFTYLYLIIKLFKNTILIIYDNNINTNCRKINTFLDSLWKYWCLGNNSKRTTK